MTARAVRRADAPVGTASARYQRLLYTSEGIAAILYTPILLPGSAGILAQTPQLEPWYGYGLIAVALGLPVVLGILSWFTSRRFLEIFATVTALVFVVAMMLFPLGLPTDTMKDDAAPWYQGIHALHGMIAATAWRHKGIWAYALAQAVVIGVVQNEVRTDAAKASILNSVSSFVFIIILMAVAQSIVGAAYRLDATAQMAREAGVTGATARTTEREASRIDAMVHDDIMSVLLTAARPEPPSGLGEQASKALTAIGTLERHETPERLYGPTEALAVLRGAAEAAAPDVPVAVTRNAAFSVPASAVTALSDAMAEALRNSLRHADTGRSRVVRAVDITMGDSSVTVTVSDNGKGFVMRNTPGRRLGIRLSIIERMSLVDGGWANVESKPGKGTTVTLGYERTAS